jgi:hypothetical protein
MAEPKSFPALLFLLEHEESSPRFDPRVAKDARTELEKARELLAASADMQKRSGYGVPAEDWSFWIVRWQAAIAACRERS